MICKSCNKEFKTEDGELKIRQARHVPAPELCPICRRIDQNDMLKQYSFTKLKCPQCGKDFITGSNLVGKRTVICNECYDKFLDSANPSEEIQESDN